MKIISGEASVRTKQRNEMINITRQVADFVKQSGLTNGQIVVHCPHTTAAITINENADPDVVHDMLLTLSDLLPKDRKGYRHYEGNSDSHCKSSIIGCSERILIDNRNLVLGTWQGIFFCEFDGPRSRKVVFQASGE